MSARTWVTAVVLLGWVVSAVAGAEEAAEQPTKVLVEFKFDDGKGLPGRFRGNWHSNQAKEARLSLDAPLGTGNDSTKVMTCHTRKALPYVSCEAALHGTLVEPQGWDGFVSFRFYNDGFESFYMTYLPLVPSDVTFHRAYFKAPKGQWVDMTLPLDKFLYRARRPRRGAPLEYLVFVAEGAESDDSVFQFDDFRLYRVRQADPPKAKPKPPLGRGVIYRQDFDDPNDFDLESYYPWTRYCTTFRAPGGLDANGKPIEDTEKTEAGCLRVAGFRQGDQATGGRRVDFRGEGTVIEFDCMVQGASDFALIVRNKKDRKKFRQYPQPQPVPGKWQHYVVSAEDFVPFGIPTGEAAGKKYGKPEEFFELLFYAWADKTKEPHYILIDNLVIRKETKPAEE